MRTSTIIYKVAETGVPMCTLDMLPASVLCFQVSNHRHYIYWSVVLFPKDS